MKKYTKPTLDSIELRLEERVAKCYDTTSKVKSNPGDHPGNKEHCPSAS